MYIKNDGGIMKNQSPCIDCITLGVCKALMNDQYGLSILMHKCSIFEEYYNYKYIIPGSAESIFLLKLFKPLCWKERLTHSEEVAV